MLDLLLEMILLGILEMLEILGMVVFVSNSTINARIRLEILVIYQEILFSK